MLDLNRREKDVRLFVRALEEWIIQTLWRFNVQGHVRDGRVGVWVERPDRGYSPLTEDKIAAIGVRTSRGRTLHGFALNVCTDLAMFDHIIACGLAGRPVTSLANEGFDVTMDEVMAAIRKSAMATWGVSASVAMAR